MTLKPGDRVYLDVPGLYNEGAQGTVVGHPTDNKVMVFADDDGAAGEFDLSMLRLEGAEPAPRPPTPEDMFRGEMVGLMLAYTLNLNPGFWNMFQQFDERNKQIVIDGYKTGIHDLINEVIVRAKKYDLK